MLASLKLLKRERKLWVLYKSPQQRDPSASVLASATKRENKGILNKMSQHKEPSV